MRTKNAWNFHETLKTVWCQLRTAWTCKKTVGSKKKYENQNKPVQLQICNNNWIIFASDKLLWLTAMCIQITYCYTHHSNRLSEHVHQVHMPLSRLTCFESYHTAQGSQAELRKKIYIMINIKRSKSWPCYEITNCPLEENADLIPQVKVTFLPMWLWFQNLNFSS